MELKSTLSESFFRRFCPDPTVMYDLGEIYAEFNALYFNGGLPILPCKTRIDENGETWSRYDTLKWDGRMGRRILGTYKTSARRGFGTIRLSRVIAGDPVKTRSILLHEMLHKYLDFECRDDGIKGHGENFVKEAKRINKLCESTGVKHRIQFYDEEITQSYPFVLPELLGDKVHCSKDLDIARNMQSVMRAAFSQKFEYFQ